MKSQGLNATQIKWIALFFMTVDHLIPLLNKVAALSFVMPFLEATGRIAAPLFLFVIVESVRHTKSKYHFIIRLYIAGVATNLFTIGMNLILFGESGCYWPRNILFTYFYGVLYITIILNIYNAYKQHNPRKITVAVLLFLATALPQVAYSVIVGHLKSRFVLDLFTTIFPPVLFTEYSLAFVLLGILFYFQRNRAIQCITFALFCIISYLGSLASLRGWALWPFNSIFADGQHWMVLALPMMAMYNGKRGQSHKWFFYVYYPLHRYLIFLLSVYISFA